ncbi:MAG TPA: branched-chain amino acid transport system II carrier protein, partial [Myxococcota bacterium]|nr:branched-chain amino acid transport system II carrier protein [Myxococcota bacterium]
MADKSPSTLVVGLALFSMFFGSGNLIFPLMLGAQYESYFLVCAAGFIITGVLLPTLGILAMLPAHGHYERLFTNILPEKWYRWFFLLVLIFWIPLGSGPRCVVLAHASISNHLPFTTPVWLFSLAFLIIVYFSVVTRSRVIEILGKYLTPALLFSILCIVISSFINGKIAKSDLPAASIFVESVIAGYYTQDLIAAVFFSSAIVGMLNLNAENRISVLRKTWYGGLIAVLLLTVLYTALMAASAVHAEQLQGLSGEKLVSTLSHIT